MIISNATSLRQAIMAFLEEHENIEAVGLGEDGIYVTTDDGDDFFIPNVEEL